MVMKFPHLNLIDWPFREVPDENDENLCSFIADRAQLNSDVRILLRNLSRRAVSSMHLMWAWFGAGKTHTLFHIKYLCKTEFKNLIPVYIEFPKPAKNFLDLYRKFISKLDMDIIDDTYSRIYGEKIQEDLHCDFPDLSNALTLRIGGTEIQRDIVNRWLRGECKELRSLKIASISKPIQTGEDCIKVIFWILRLVSLSKSDNPLRIIWMIDEFQRIEDCRPSTQEEINSCLHATFNRCPNHLSIIISFSGHPEQKKLPSWLSMELKDRMDITPLLLPRLSKEEGFKFIQEVLQHFRTPGHTISNVFFPFEELAVQRVFDLIEQKAKESKLKDEPKPRTIMKVFKKVLEEADPKIENDEMKIIDVNFVDEILKGISLLQEQ